MRGKLLTILVIGAMLGALAFGQTVTTISAIQDTTGTGSADSPFDGQEVTVTGIVSAESWAFGNNYYFIQDGAGAWSGIKVYDPDRGNAYGDSVQITATVDEYYGMTELINVTDYVKLDSGKTVTPTVVSTGEIGTSGNMAEAYESVLITVVNAEITNPDLGYGEWEINDGSGACRVDDAAEYYFDPTEYDSVKSVTGVLDYSYSNTKIQPRLAYDVVESGIYTRIQRIQQVRYSDLLKSFTDAASDTSYMRGDTVTVTGVVTMPTGLSYAGAGIKFIFAEPEGGPWSAILSYNPDSTAYPVLYEGDLIEMTGYIDEYSTGPSNMTEFWITSPINILNIGQPLPPVDTVSTGDLRLPVDAEQWGNVIVAVKNAVVTDVNLQYELFALDDGTGECLVDDDSDSLNQYYSNNPLPPLGTIAESASGWVYHHYGSYVDSTTYKLEPLYVDDIVWGAGPALLSNVYRDPASPTSSDAVDVYVDIQTNNTVDSATVYYAVDGGAYQTVAMTQGTGDTWSGAIPAQSDGSWVDYFIEVVDDQGQVSLMPADTSVINYSYPVKDAGLTIADLQYTPWELADSPFEGYSVTVTGIVTGDTTMKANYGAYTIQDDASPWSGIFIFGTDEVLLRGDEVQVWGTVTDYNADWHFKWDNNTVILLDSVKVLSSGNNEPAPMVVTSADLANGSATAEQYEGTLVRVNNVQVTSVNTYDWSIDDGTGACLLDDDASSMDAWFDTLAVGAQLEMAQGVFTFSFGTYKIETRDLTDVGVITGITDNPIAYPLAFNLGQNFPNPFNPETRIYFEVPTDSKVSLVVYNILGQKVRTLTSDVFPAGKHVVNWDGRNDSGEQVTSGTYLVRMKAGSYMATKKMSLLR